MPYGHISFLQAKTELAQKLYPSSPFYTDAELGIYVLEALRTFNSLANFQRSEFSFTLPPSVTWYDLTDTTNLPTTIRPFTVTDLNLINQIQYHFLEPINSSYPLVWAGSKQFSLADIMKSLQQIRDQVLSETGCTITQSIIAANAGRTYFSEKVIDMRRVFWIPNTGFGYSPNLLFQADAWEAQSFEPDYPQASAGTPTLFMRSTQPPNSFDVDIQPAVHGNYDILTVNAGDDLSTSASSLLRVPDDWAWVIKWGALAMLLNRDSTARDSVRAQYCLDKFKQGMVALSKAPALLSARINNVTSLIDAVSEADQYAANWQADTPGVPESVFHAGLNMVAPYPIPGAAAPYSMTVSVVSNMTVPTSDAAYLQIGRDDVEAILGEAQHVATFKQGGAEFLATMDLHASFVRHCALYNSKLTAMSEFRELLYGRSQRDKLVNPEFSTIDPETVEANSGR